MKSGAFSYLRVSGGAQAEGDGFQRQRETIARYARAHRIRVVQEFRDEGISGTKEMLDRPGLTDLFVALKSNGVRLVLVENATRVARDLMVGEIVLAEFRKIGVKVVSADGGVDLTHGSDDPTGTLVRQILSAVSEWEKTLLVQKLRASRLRIRRSGRQCEGRKPFGQTAEERHTIERVLAWKASGRSDTWIANQLNQSRTPTRAGGQSRWHRMMVYRIVARAGKQDTRPAAA